MVNNGSIVDILYYSVVIKMGYKRGQLQPPKDPIYSFTNTTTLVVGTICLQLTLGEGSGRVSCMAEFVVVGI